MAIESAERAVDEDAVEGIVAKALAGMSLAGHDITDSILIDLVRGYVRGDVDRSEYLARWDERVAELMEG